MTANSETVQWSVEKQKCLQDHLVGEWAEDIWVFAPTTSKRSDKSYFRFTLASSSLKVEVKYALWSKFDSGEWKVHTQHGSQHRALHWLIRWLNSFIPPIHSFMDKSLEQWELSFRSYLVQYGSYRRPGFKHLNAEQEYVGYLQEDHRILLLGQIYNVILEVYDDRPETEKDIWDMRKLELPVNLSSGIYFLNFTLIALPWLRQLAKAFMKYRIAMHSPSDCRTKLESIVAFSRFLSEHAPECNASDINRTLIISYISYLNRCNIADRMRRSRLSHLRTFHETCVYRLSIKELVRERIIFDDDFPSEPQWQSREIPDEVLEQLRSHLQTLPTTIMRMVVILLECGMRINELCSLPLDCLIYDDKGHYSLRYYQSKSKQEHVVPLVEDTVIDVIQAQQQEVCERWSDTCPYLFPKIDSPTLPFKTRTFAERLNVWAVENDIRDATGKLYRFQAHQFRHTVGMKLLNKNIPLDVISRLLGHRRISSTQIYARTKAVKLREELEKAARKRKTIDYRGQVVKEDAYVNDAATQLSRQGIRGQTLPVGGCGRPTLKGDCEHANKCLTCTFWLTSTDDLPRLRAFYRNALRLRQRAIETGNQIVVRNQDHIISTLAVRIAKLEETDMKGSLSVEELLSQLRIDLIETESALEEAREAGRLVAAKRLELMYVDLKTSITALEGTL